MVHSSRLNLIFLQSLAKQINSEIELQSANLDTGREYSTAILHAQNIRYKRRKNYGDAFMQDSDEFLIAQLENKLARLKANIGKSDGEESVVDSAADMINYSAFILAKRLAKNG